MPHRKGSFHEDWDDLLRRFARQRRYDRTRNRRLATAGEEVLNRNGCRIFRLNQALFETSDTL